MVGHFNEALDSDPENRVEENPVFVVGNGSDDLNRSNAFVVKRNGDIVIPKTQGDISMGIYE